MKKLILHWGNQKQPWIQKPTHRWKQVHGTRVVLCEPGIDCGEADGLISKSTIEPVSVVTADCVPILLASQKDSLIGALHAGWKGTVKNIVSEWAQSVEKLGFNPENFQAWIGPSIKRCCYEVSLEVIQQFELEFPMIDPDLYIQRPRQLDLASLNAELLKAVGVTEITIHPDCTFCKKDDQNQATYFSYRRGDRDSRQFSSIQWDAS